MLKTGKGYKSFKDRHISLLQDQIKDTEAKQKAQAEANKQKIALRKKKRSKLSDKELDIVIAEEVRESLQPKDELKANSEREKERLEAKAEYYRQKLAELKETPKKKKEVEFDAVGNIKEVIDEVLEEAEDKIIDILDLDKTPEATTWIETEATATNEVPLKVIIAEKEEIADEMRRIADEMNGETKELQWLTAKRPDWIAQFELEEGGKAVWQGRITNGFKQWCEAKGYKIGG